MFSERKFIKNIHENYKLFIGKNILICGMIDNIRKQSNIAFLDINDGTSLKGVQVILDKNENISESYKNILEKGSKGTILSIKGKIIESPAKGQDFELVADADGIDYFDCIVDSSEYSISKNRIPLETLRQDLHLRMRTKLLSSVTRVRSKTSMLTHVFFQDQDYQYIHTPLITSSDCEGAGETFTVTNLLPDKIDKNIKIDNYEKDFFGKKTSLTVSGQLNVECYAMYFSKVYTFGPTFRAENSNTSRHLAEFWMIEPEITYINLEELMDLAENYLKHCVKGVMISNSDEINLFNKFVSKGLLERLTNISEGKFTRISYTEAVELYNKKNKEKIKWGDDLSSEVEKYICEKVFNNPTIIYNYPKEIKAFYMKNNADDKTVQAFDILVPGIGEIIGGSIREENYEILKKKIIDNNISLESLKWYLDLRKFGTCPHGGFGLGFERLIMLLTGLSNIRDVIPFPRYPKHCNC
jgi:asparaginyl-tRNA synthetase